MELFKAPHEIDYYELEKNLLDTETHINKMTIIENGFKLLFFIKLYEIENEKEEEEEDA